jgi:AraC family transcriptional regulator of adaptative response / DNA-3-methyladenine glycosylase II
VKSVTLRLPFTRPYAWGELLAFLAARAIPGVEAVGGGAYRRTFALDGAAGSFAVGLGDDAAHVVVRIRVSRVAALPAVVGRVRRLLDLDADAEEIDRHLAKDPLLAPRVAARRGLRVPGAWDPFELAVRAILGQQVSVAAARTLAGRIAALCGGRVAGAEEGAPSRVFPGPERLTDARLDGIGLTRARASAIAALARAAGDDPALLRPAGDLEATIARLDALPGIGRWTAQVIAMRALRQPDAFPDRDLGIVRALERAGVGRAPEEILRRAERWRPWRAYAALHLWAGEAPGVTPDAPRPSRSPRPRPSPETAPPRAGWRG